MLCIKYAPNDNVGFSDLCSENGIEEGSKVQSFLSAIYGLKAKCQHIQILLQYSLISYLCRFQTFVA